MPTIGVKEADLFAALGRKYSEEEFSDLCFDYGLELDEITSEKQMLLKEQGNIQSEDISDEAIYRVEVPANRYDLLCLEGLARALLIFQGKLNLPVYHTLPTKSCQRITVRPSTTEVRPHIVGAILRNISLNESSYKSFIDLQEKLHQNICRKRTLVSIGTHDLDAVSGPFVYDAKRPSDIRFVPLNQTKEFSAAELMDFYQDSHLRHYLQIIRDKPLYPVVLDSNGSVLSLPPVINGNKSKISVNTKNILIEVTATDLTKASIVLDTVVTMFSEYCSDPFSIEPIEIENADGTVERYPKLSYRKYTIVPESVNKYIGISLSDEEMVKLLTKMGLQSKVVKNGKTAKIEVVVPPTRQDIIHVCDIVEDIAISYGYNNIVKTVPLTNTIAAQLPINKLTNQLRHSIAQSGFTEALTFSLCSSEDISSKMKKNLADLPAAHIANPKTADFQVVRTTLLPGLIKTAASNKKMPIPFKLFEISDIVVLDQDKDVGARNERRLCVLYCGKNSGFEVVHGLLDRTMKLLEVDFATGTPSSSTDKNNQKDHYHLEPANDVEYFPGRCASIVVGSSNLRVGSIGILHPDVVTAFDLPYACSSFEINIEPFL